MKSIQLYDGTLITYKASSFLTTSFQFDFSVPFRSQSKVKIQIEKDEEFEKHESWEELNLKLETNLWMTLPKLYAEVQGLVHFSNMNTLEQNQVLLPKVVLKRVRICWIINEREKHTFLNAVFKSKKSKCYSSSYFCKLKNSLSARNSFFNLQYPEFIAWSKDKR
jgi:hypothetical protein